MTVRRVEALDIFQDRTRDNGRKGCGRSSEDVAPRSGARRHCRSEAEPSALLDQRRALAPLHVRTPCNISDRETGDSPLQKTGGDCPPSLVKQTDCDTSAARHYDERFRVTAVRFIVTTAPGLGSSFTPIVVLGGRCVPISSTYARFISSNVPMSLR